MFLNLKPQDLSLIQLLLGGLCSRPTYHHGCSDRHSDHCHASSVNWAKEMSSGEINELHGGYLNMQEMRKRNLIFIDFSVEEFLHLRTEERFICSSSTNSHEGQRFLMKSHRQDDDDELMNWGSFRDVHHFSNHFSNGGHSNMTVRGWRLGWMEDHHHHLLTLTTWLSL